MNKCILSRMRVRSHPWAGEKSKGCTEMSERTLYLAGSEEIMLDFGVR